MGKQAPDKKSGGNKARSAANKTTQKPKRPAPEQSAPEELLDFTDEELAPGIATSNTTEAENAPWHQMPGEPLKYFSAFSRFRLMGSDRSLLGIYNSILVERGREKQSSVSGAWDVAAKEWHWKERAELWDRHQRDIQETEYEARRKKLQDDSLVVAETMVNKAKIMLSFPLVKQRIEETYTHSDGTEIPVVTVMEPASWTFNTPARLMGSAEKVARLAHDIEMTRLLREIEKLDEDGLDCEAGDGSANDEPDSGETDDPAASGAVGEAAPPES